MYHELNKNEFLVNHIQRDDDIETSWNEQKTNVLQLTDGVAGKRRIKRPSRTK